MLRNNKELWCSLLILCAITGILTALGASLSPQAGVLVLLCGLGAIGVHLAVEGYRYRRLRQLSHDLDQLLVSGEPLPIHAYSEGELSILANQIQKMTLRLTESAKAVKEEKGNLANSLADISHQLRTPLTAMSLTAAMLHDAGLPADKRVELSRELSRLLNRTQWLVESLLKLSRLDAGTVKLAADTVAVRPLILRAAAPLAIAMDLRSQRLDIRCRTESFTGDLTWTAEALGNILKNCMEHTPEGGAITVAALETVLFTQITVEDTGPGFAEQDIPHLFERFYKGSNASENSYGIGLALARTVITAQNGTVQAMNGADGARFVIKFYKQII